VRLAAYHARFAPIPTNTTDTTMHKLSFAAMPLFATALLAQGTPESEPNDVFSTATVLALGAQGDGAIGLPGDVDFWKVTLTVASDLRFWLNPGVGATPMEDSDLALIASDGITVLATNDDVSAATNWLSRIVAGNLPAGDYYLRVRSSAAFLPLGTGSYTIDVVAATPGLYVAVVPPLTPVTESLENNDPRPAFGSGTATLASLFSRSSGLILPPLPTAASGTGATTVGKDYDFYEFTVTAPGMITLSTMASPTALPVVVDDTVIRLFDSAFTSLAFNDDFGGGAYSQLTFNIATPGTYYACVSGYYGGTSTTPSTGNYLLDILGSLAVVPTGAATVTIQTGGCGGVTLGTRSTIAPAPLVRTEVPVLGSTFYLDGAGMEAGTLAVRLVGFSVLGSPLDLGNFGGAPGCFIEVDIVAALFIVADANGNDSWPFSTPVDLAFNGLSLEHQLAALHSTLNIVASNRVSAVCGITN